MSMMVKACADELFFFPIGAVKDSRRGLAKTVRPELVVEIGVASVGIGEDVGVGVGDSSGSVAKDAGE